MRTKYCVTLNKTESFYQPDEQDGSGSLAPGLAERRGVVL